MTDESQEAIDSQPERQGTEGVTEAGARSVTLRDGWADLSVARAREYFNNTRTVGEETALAATGADRRRGVRNLIIKYKKLSGKDHGTMYKNTIDVLSSLLPPLNAEIPEPTMASLYTALRPAALVAEAVALSGASLADLEKSLKTATEHAVTSIESQSSGADSDVGSIVALSPVTLRSLEAFQKKVWALAIDYCQ